MQFNNECKQYLGEDKGRKTLYQKINKEDIRKVKQNNITCKNRRSSSHCLTGMTLSLASFHSFATTTATLFAVTLARPNSLLSVFLSS